MLPVPQLRGTGEQNGYGGNVPLSQQAYAPQTQPGFGQGNPAFGQQAMPYGPANPAYQANLDLLLAQAKAQGADEARKAAEKANPPVNQVTSAEVASKTDAKEADEPWLPLILTTLMLFASLGTNVFLGWLAWSFFWRFRDAAGDATRAQTTLFPTRQAA